MNVSFNITPATINTGNVGGPNETKKTDKSQPTLTITVTAGEGAGGAGAASSITLSYPLVGPEDIQINEFLEQLQSLSLEQMKGMTMTAAVLLLNQQVGELGAEIINGGAAYVEANAAQLKETFDGLEQQAANAETQLYDLISNSNYPDFNTFLSQMLTAAQELRKLASEAKMNLAMGEYENVLAQADQMMVAAQKNYESTMKTLEAEKKEAIGKIISGTVSLLSTFAFGAMGARGGGGTSGFMTGAQMGGSVGSGLGNIIDGSFSLAANADKVDAANLKLEADLADVHRKRLEASQKLLQEAQSLTGELRDLAKTLSDMVLKLYQDFMSSQQQIIQRANI